MKKQILIGADSFEKIIGGNYFYIDKSLLFNNSLRINDESYFMKRGKRYSLNCYTEHIASTFIRECGYSAQQNCNIDECVTKIWEMCLFDVLLDIRDRHCGNVGFCNKNGERTFSPLFDNADSLFPYINEEHNFFMNSPERMITHDFAYCWFASKQKNECPSDLLGKFQEIDVVSAMDRSTVGFKEIWRSFYRSIVYYRHKCLIKGDEFVWEGMK